MIDVDRKVAFILSLFVLLSILTYARFSPFKTEANDTYRVHNLDTGLNYTTIQGAIDANETLPGHTIFVDSGTYYENVVVNKKISLEGENRETTIISAGSGVGIKVVANGTRISGFTVCNAMSYSPFGGAIVVGGFDNVISDNIAERNRQGIVLMSGGNNTLRDNMIVNSSYRGLVIYSSNNTFRNNALVNNSLYNLDLENPYQDIDISNTLNGKPIVYLFEKQNLTLSPDMYPQEIGMLYLFNSTNIVVEGFNISYSENSDFPGHDYNIFLLLNVNVTIRNNTISHGAGIVSDSSNVFISNNIIHDNSGEGFYGLFPKWTYITQNIFYNNYNGITIVSGSYNTIWENTFYNNTQDALRMSGSFNTVYGNNITNNGRGIAIGSGSIGNTIAHNNFINNTGQVYVSGEQINIWDLGYPSSGNYWSDYNGTDSDYDGIGDTPYFIDANNQDDYPLMGMFSSFNTSYGYVVDFVSNSSISNFSFNLSPIEVYPPEAILTFNVSGETDTEGFLRVCIPKVLINGSYVIRFDGEIITNTTYPQVRELPCSNETHLYFYINYTHSEHAIIITGTTMIPEFLSFLILPTFMIATLLAVIVCRRKHVI